MTTETATVVVTGPDAVTVVLDEASDSVQVVTGPDQARVVSTAAIGPRGEPGPPGPPGGGTYIHHQDVPSDTWVISHGLDRYPPLAIVDSSGRVVIPGEVTYDSTVQLTATFGAAFSGRAYL